MQIAKPVIWINLIIVVIFRNCLQWLFDSPQFYYNKLLEILLISL